MSTNETYDKAMNLRIRMEKFYDFQRRLKSLNFIAACVDPVEERHKARNRRKKKNKKR